MSTDALELALALNQAPIQRFTLRDRPLPKNIGDALQLASAMQPQLERVAARFSEPEETIVEAVRFYLQQVLFEPGTDAYRVLGLNPTAKAEQIRQHHIWLQRWLHPDRRGEDWEAVLATKVNWAWQQLRNDASRNEYDRTRNRSVELPATSKSASHAIQAPAWNAAPIETPGPHWLRLAIVGGLMLLCLGLFFLAVTRQDRVDPDALASRAVDSRSTIPPQTQFDRKPRSNLPSDSRLAIPRKPATANAADDKSEPGPLARSDPSGPPVIFEDGGTANGSKASRSGSTSKNAESTAFSVAPAAQPSLSDGEKPDSNRLMAANGAQTSAVIEGRDKSDAVAAQLPAGSNRIPPPGRPSEGNLAAREASRSAGTVPVSRETGTRPDRVAGVQQVDTPTARVNEPGNVRAKAVALPKTVAPITPVPAPIARVETAETISAPANAAAMAAARPRIADLVADAENEIDQSAQLSSEALSRETLARFEDARDRVRSMVNYFQNRGFGKSPWVDEFGLRSLEHERNAILVRNGKTQVESFALAQPNWRITHSAVALQATYHVDADRASAESGRFNLDMTWRDGDWKITRIEVSPSR